MRSRRFLEERHGRRFLVAHGRLRQVLGEQLGLPAERIEFRAGAHGKPELAGAAALSGLQFNLSHSADAGLIGWARHRFIGVDIEAWRELTDEQQLVHRYFSPHEIAAYEALQPARRQQGFFQCWTRKEAFIKAVGRGLGLPLDSFDVSLGSDDARLLRVAAHAAGGRRWSLAAVPVQGNVSAAVVLEGDVCRVIRST